MLPICVREDLGAKALKGYSAFHRTLALLEPHHQIVKCHKQDTLWEWTCYREAVSVFYSPSWLSKWEIFFFFRCVLHLIGLVGRVFTNGLGDRGSIPGRVIPKTLKMVLDSSLLNIQHYKVCIKDIVEKSWERSWALPYTTM